MEPEQYNEQPQSGTANKFSVPVAIVVAGALIAGAVFLSGTGGVKRPDTKSDQALGSGVIEIAPIEAIDHIVGNPNANAVVVEFSDTECPFCKNFHDTMNQLMESHGKDGKVAWVYRHFPIVQLHSKAPKEAEATECAAEQGGNDMFWRYINKMMEITPSNDKLDPKQLPKIAGDLGLDVKKFETCLSTGKYENRVKRDFDDARKAGASGTPTSVILVKDKVSDDVKRLLADIAVKFGIGPDSLVISKDDKAILIGGAFPYEIMAQIIDALNI